MPPCPRGVDLLWTGAVVLGRRLVGEANVEVGPRHSRPWCPATFTPWRLAARSRRVVAAMMSLCYSAALGSRWPSLFVVLHAHVPHSSRRPPSFVVRPSALPKRVLVAQAGAGAGGLPPALRLVVVGPRPPSSRSSPASAASLDDACTRLLCLLRLRRASALCFCVFAAVRCAAVCCAVVVFLSAPLRIQKTSVRFFTCAWPMNSPPNRLSHTTTKTDLRRDADKRPTTSTLPPFCRHSSVILPLFCHESTAIPPLFYHSSAVKQPRFCRHSSVILPLFVRDSAAIPPLFCRYSAVVLPLFCRHCSDTVLTAPICGARVAWTLSLSPFRSFRGPCFLVRACTANAHRGRRRPRTRT